MFTMKQNLFSVGDQVGFRKGIIAPEKIGKIIKFNEYVQNGAWWYTAMIQFSTCIQEVAVTNLIKLPTCDPIREMNKRLHEINQSYLCKVGGDV